MLLHNCLFIIEEILYSITAVSELGQAPMLQVFLGRRYRLSRVNRWSDCIGYRIEIVRRIRWV